MSELPKGWADTTFEDVLDYVQRGKSPKYADESKLPVINQKCVRWWGIQEEFLKFIRSNQIDTYTEERFLRKGDILWNSTGTGTIGRAALFQGLETASRAVVDGHVTILRSSAAIDPRYLFSFIRSPNVQSRIEDMQSGTTNQVELSKSEILKTEIPLPPLPEQRRIVRKLDSLSARTTTARTHLTAIAKLVEEFRASILDQVMIQADAKHDWDQSNLEAVRSPEATIRYGVVQPGANTDKGVQLIRVMDMMGGVIAWDQLRRVAPEIDEAYAKARVENDDVLVSVVGTIGRVALVSGLVEQTNIARAVARIRPDKSKVDPKWLSLRLMAADVQARFEGDVREVARKTLNIGLIKETPFKRPPLETQRAIVKTIEAAFSKIDHLAEETAKTLKLADRLDERILARAFAGELVPQDPNDGPASVLLDRIREARAYATKKPMKKPTKAKSMKVAPQERVLTDSAEWPEQGLPFEDIAKRLTLPHDDLKDAVFALLEGDAPKLRQKFDTDAKVMKLARVAT